MNTFESLLEGLSDREGNPDEDWLIIKGDGDDLDLDNDCPLAIIEIDEVEEIVPAELQERGLHSTIDYGTVKASIAWADRLAGRKDDEAASEIIRYYIRFDAWPEKLGAPDPPPADVDHCSP